MYHVVTVIVGVILVAVNCVAVALDKMETEQAKKNETSGELNEKAEREQEWQVCLVEVYTWYS